MRILIIILFLIVNLGTQAQETSERQKTFNTNKNVAIQGYDPISYFKEGPEEGNSSIQFSYEGITYYFSSTENLNLFKGNPKMYEPQYGGWCAYAMGETGEKVKIDPETYKIKDGNLYLFYNFWGTNTLESWSENEDFLMKKANGNWLKIK
jgi:YHS domain-containing protein